MRKSIDLTTEVLYRLEKIAAVQDRSLEGQILYYLHIALEAEWQACGAEILETLSARRAYQDAYWDEHQEEAVSLGLKEPL